MIRLRFEIKPWWEDLEFLVEIIPVAAAAVRVIRSPAVRMSTADLTTEVTCSWSVVCSAISMHCVAKSSAADATAWLILEPEFEFCSAAIAATAAASPATETAACMTRRQLKSRLSAEVDAESLDQSLDIY
ncbi:hypothetical protein AKJ16_DCAP14552 [Drosera capensis]